MIFEDWHLPKIPVSHPTHPNSRFKLLQKQQKHKFLGDLSSSIPPFLSQNPSSPKCQGTKGVRDRNGHIRKTRGDDWIKGQEGHLDILMIFGCCPLEGELDGGGKVGRWEGGCWWKSVVWKGCDVFFGGDGLCCCVCVFFGGVGWGQQKKGWHTKKRCWGVVVFFVFFCCLMFACFPLFSALIFVLKNIFLFVMVYFWRHSDISDIKLETINLRSHEWINWHALDPYKCKTNTP